MKKTILTIGTTLFVAMNIIATIDGTISFFNKIELLNNMKMTETLYFMQEIANLLLPFVYVGAYLMLWKILNKEITETKIVLRDHALRIQLLNAILESNKLIEARYDTVRNHLTPKELVEIGFDESYISNLETNRDSQTVSTIKLGNKHSWKVKGENL